MALSIGELVGYLTLDDSAFEKGVDGAKKKFSDAGGWLKDNAKKIGLAGGAALGAAVSAGVAANINTGKANDKLAAQLGLTAKESERIGKVAGSLYRDAYGDSIEGVNDAVGAVMSSIKGMSKASAKDLESTTAKALDFATAFDVDVQRAVQVAGQAVSTGLAKDANQAFDLITAASQKVPANLREDVLDAADEYGQFFSSLGYDGKEAFAILVDASEKGMYGIDKAGDAIKEFTIRATDMSDATKGTYDLIGLDAQKMANKLLAGGDTAREATGQIIDGLLAIKDPAQRANASIALFGTPLEDLNTSEIPAFLQQMKGMSGSMDDAGGASKRMGAALNDNFATRMEGWKRQAMGFIQDALMKLSDWGIKAFAWAKDNQAWLLPLAAGLGTVGGIIGTIIGAMKVWRAITVAYTAAQAALNVVLMANPIGLVVVALAGLVAGLVVAYKKSETFRTIVNTAFGAVKTAVVAVVNWFRNKFIPFFTKTLPATFRRLMNWVKGNWPKILAILTGPIGLAVLAIRKHWGKIRGAFTSAKNWVVGIFRRAWDATKQVVMAPIQDARDGLRALLGPSGPVRGVFNAVKSWVTGVFKRSWDGLRTIFTDPVQAARNVFNNLLGAGGPIRGAFSRAVDAIGGIWDRLKRLAARPVNFIINTVYNRGLRRALNLLPGVDLDEAKSIKFASGGVLPGWSPGQDIHRFYSPTAGVLDLSGGEAVMRPEFTRAVGGPEGVARLNRMARNGALAQQAHATGGVVSVDGEPMSQVAAAQLALAERLSGIAMHVMQGSYQPATSYSGTSHTGGGVMDTSPGSWSAQSWLRKVGFAAWARNIPGAAYAGSGAHIHAVSRLDPTARGHAQLSSFARGEDGLGGRDYGPNPPLLPNLQEMLGKIGALVATSGSSGGLGAIIDKVKDFVGDVKRWVGELSSMGGFGPMMMNVVRAVGDKIRDYINDKIPGPGPIPAFDTGGVAAGVGYLPKRTIRPERVLSPRQTEAFERLVSTLENDGGRGQRPIELHHHYPSGASEAAVAASTGRTVAALTAMGV